MSQPWTMLEGCKNITKGKGHVARNVFFLESVIIRESPKFVVFFENVITTNLMQEPQIRKNYLCHLVPSLNNNGFNDGYCCYIEIVAQNLRLG